MRPIVLAVVLSASFAHSAPQLEPQCKEGPALWVDHKPADAMLGMWQLAQVEPSAGEKYTMRHGMVDGEIHGENVGTGGKFVAGLATGFLTGFIGTGIGYFIIGPASLNMRARIATEGKGSNYYLGFETGWNKKTKSKKRNAFLGGGAIGTGIFLVIALSAGS